MSLSLYNLGWRLLRPCISPFLLFRALKGKEIPSRIGERFGRLSPAPPQKGAIWLHAVSVGETIGALSLIQNLYLVMPEAHFLITTNTTTAFKLIDKEIKANPEIPLSHAFQPLDHPDFVGRFLTNTEPSVAVFMESDFWPNLLSCTAKNGIPVIFASSQLSDTTFRRWQWFPEFARTIFPLVTLALVIDEKQAKLFNKLGVFDDRIDILGSLKSTTLMRPNPNFCKSLRGVIGYKKIFLAASTHQGEDKIVIDAAKRLDEKWITIIAPRHPERGKAIARAAENAPRRSLEKLPNPNSKIFVMDSMGEMASLFSLANIVFLGASLIPKGGHNPLEPASFGLPIITGPHVFKNRAEFGELRKMEIVFDLNAKHSKSGVELANLILKIDANTQKQRERNKHAKKHVEKAKERSLIAAKKIKGLIESCR